MTSISELLTVPRCPTWAYTHASADPGSADVHLQYSYRGLAAIHSSCLRLSSSDRARLLSSNALNEESIAF